MPENNNPNFGNIEFNLPKNQSNAIKVIGVGGGGSNAVNYMLTQGINGVDFVICNTDAQALQNSQVPTKIQLGVTLTEGLGAGANPEVGASSATESEAEIKEMLGTNTKMVFINAGMGGGTGTGAAPVIAKIARELDLLTIGIVTTPFKFEGAVRNEQAQKGIDELRKYVDSMVVINNDKLRDVYGNLGFKAGFAKADEVLATASRGIAEVITHHYTQNIDLRDAKTVLANSGTAIMGSAKASGKDRAEVAISQALDSPLLNDNKIEGAKNVLLLIVSGTEEITIDEIGEINDFIQSEAKTSVNIIMGVGEDDSLGDSIAVTIVATGFRQDQQTVIAQKEPKKIVHVLGKNQKTTFDLTDSEEFVATSSPEEEVINDEQEDVRIVHSLDESEEVVELISTSEIIKNIEVVHEEISYQATDDFIITTVANELEVVDHEVVESQDENQITFAFDEPIIQEANTPERIDMEVVNNTEVVQPIEVAPNMTESKDVVFDLGAYEEEVEVKFVKKQKEVCAEVKVEDELQFIVKTEEKEAPKEVVGDVQEASPMDLTFEEIRKGAEARKKKMNKFNYKFKNNAAHSTHVDEIEKVPAYKRMGVELDTTLRSSESIQSKTTLSIDENNDLQFRSNNSFLHDNVD